MGFLGSQYVKPNSYALTAASWVGFRPIVEMWQIAQQTRLSKLRCSDNAIVDGDEKTLSDKAKDMLKLAAHLVHESPDDNSYSDLARCLCDVGLIEKTGSSDEFTWFRLPEWMQVEMIRSFAQFLENEPWFRFPFGDFFKTYLSVLFKEVKVVSERHNLSKAVLSWGFVINFVPAIVMGVIFGQLFGLALPCRMALGDEYTSDQLSNLVSYDYSFKMLVNQFNVE